MSQNNDTKTLDDTKENVDNSTIDKIYEAIGKLPADIQLNVRNDVYGRTFDWLMSGGKSNDNYIKQQLRYVEGLLKRVEEENGN